MPATPAALVSNKRQAAFQHVASTLELLARESVYTSEILSYPNDTAKKEASSSLIRANRTFLRAVGATLGVSWTTNWTTTRTAIVAAINALSL